MKDRRTARRFDLSLPVIVLVSIDKKGGYQTGETREISYRGVYFVIDNDFIAGAELDLTILLPGKIGCKAEVFIRATGNVIHVDKRSWNGNQNSGVAVSFKRCELVRSEVNLA